MLGGSCGELSCELSVREQGAYPGSLAASLSSAFWVLLFFGLSALAVATLFPHGTAKDLVSREEDYG